MGGSCLVMVAVPESILINVTFLHVIDSKSLSIKCVLYIS